MFLSYDLLKDKRIDVIMNKFSSFQVSLFYRISRFHVAAGLFSNRSQESFKYGKNISDTCTIDLPNASCAIFLFLLHFVVIHDLPVLLRGHTAKWNVFVKICWNSAVTFRLTYKVAAHNFCALLLMRFSMRTGIEKKKLVVTAIILFGQWFHFLNRVYSRFCLL